MPVETRGGKRRMLEEKERRKREDGVIWIEDFPLELIEEIVRHLDPRDVPKLMMVNKRLYSGYVKDESIILGDHVDFLIVVDNGASIYKHPDSQVLELDFGRHLHWIKRVTSCDDLACVMSWDGTNEASKIILNQLKSVNRLMTLRGLPSVTALTKFFTHFHASVNDYAELEIELDSFQEDQSLSDLLGNFIEKQLADCGGIRLGCDFDELIHVCYQALKKTRVKWASAMKSNGFLDIQWVVKHGIPSKNPEASFQTGTWGSLERNKIISFLTKYPGIIQAVGENCVSLLEQAKYLWEDAMIIYDRNVLCFRQKIDWTKDCIYVINYCGDERDERDLTKVFVFYIPSTSTSMK